MDLSLVVATRDRAARLPETLSRIAEIRTQRDWELVVVDNGSRDETGDILEEFAACSSLPVRSVREPEPGLGRALNAGVEAARGDVIATTDDDCYPTGDYVDSVMSVFQSHEVGFMGGRVLLHDESDARVSVFEHDEPMLLPAGGFPFPGFVGGGNLAFKRSLFEDIGGFDPGLGAGTPFPCEDIEFCARASAAGWNGGYFPAPTVYHDHGRSPGYEAERIGRSYARARGAYYAKVLLDLPELRGSCLKWWYWSLSSTRLAYSWREFLSAGRYLVYRLLSSRGGGDRSS